jgi:hypothetical protein
MRLSFFLILGIYSLNTFAQDFLYETKGKVQVGLGAYNNKHAKDYAHKTSAQIEQISSYKQQFSTVNQLRWKSMSLASDVANKVAPDKKESFEASLGENYFSVKGETILMQVGLQEISWGEAIGYNYSDVLNAKDHRETLFESSSSNKLPLLAVNLKKIFTFDFGSGAVQFVYSPRPSFSKTLPLDLYLSEYFPQSNITVTREKTPNLFDKQDYAGKISFSIEGLDLSLMHFEGLDRDPHYELESFTLTQASLAEVHSAYKQDSISLAKVVADFVFRGDLSFVQGRRFNYLSGVSLKSEKSDMVNYTIGFDTPTYAGFSFASLFAQSKLKRSDISFFRDQTEEYLLNKISYEFTSDKKINLYYNYEIKKSGQALQATYTTSISDKVDFELGGEQYWGKKNSNLAKLKSISEIFFSLKILF